MIDLHVGNPVVRGSLTVFPLFHRAAVAEPGYVLHGVEVAERAGAPVVSELVAARPWERRLTTAAVDAVGREAVPTPGHRARRFVRRARAGVGVRAPARRGRTVHVTAVAV
jgi:hypothetical protein